MQWLAPHASLESTANLHVPPPLTLYAHHAWLESTTPRLPTKLLALPAPPVPMASMSLPSAALVSILCVLGVQLGVIVRTRPQQQLLPAPASTSAQPIRLLKHFAQQDTIALTPTPRPSAPQANIARPVLLPTHCVTLATIVQTRPRASHAPATAQLDRLLRPSARQGSTAAMLQAWWHVI